MIWKDWLRRIEGLTHVRIDGGDERIAVTGANSNRWAHAARILDDAAPEKVEAFDKDGNILRMWKAPPDASELARQGGDAATAGSQLAELARVIGEVSDRAAARHENAYRAAFDAQQKLVSTISDRLFAIEKSWQQMLVVRKREIEASIITAQGGSIDEDGMNLGNLATHVLGAALGGNAQAPNGTTKGAK